MFDNKHLQIKATAMGTKVFPTYAALSLGFLEEKYLKKPQKGFAQ